MSGKSASLNLSFTCVSWEYLLNTKLCCGNYHGIAISRVTNASNLPLEGRHAKLEDFRAQKFRDSIQEKTTAIPGSGDGSQKEV